MIGKFWDHGDSCWKYYAKNCVGGLYYDNQEEALREAYIAAGIIIPNCFDD